MEYHGKYLYGLNDLQLLGKAICPPSLGRSHSRRELSERALQCVRVISSHRARSQSIPLAPVFPAPEVLAMTERSIVPTRPQLYFPAIHVQLGR